MKRIRPERKHIGKVLVKPCVADYCVNPRAKGSARCFDHVIHYNGISRAQPVPTV